VAVQGIAVGFIPFCSVCGWLCFEVFGHCAEMDWDCGVEDEVSHVGEGAP